MLKTLKTFSAAVLLCFFVQGSNAQNIFRPGFVVKTGADTLWGYVKPTGKFSKPSGCDFKTDSHSNVTKFGVSEIEGFGLTGYRYYKVVLFGQDARLLQILIRGEASLYTLDRKFYLERGGKLHELKMEYVRLELKPSVTTRSGNVLKKKTYIGTLRAVLNDCQSISASIDQVKLEEQSLSNLVEQYNRSVSVNPIVYKKDIPWARFTIGPLVGAGYTKISVTVGNGNGFLTAVHGYLEKIDFTNFVPTAGFAFSVSNPRLSENVSLTTDIRYLRSSFHGVAIDESSTYDYNDVTMKFSQLLLPLCLRYDYNMNLRTSVFIKGGLLKTYNLQHSMVTIQRQSKNPSVPDRVYTDQFLFLESTTGFTVGLGYKFRISKLQLSAEMRWDNVGPIINSTTVAFNQNTYSGILAVAF